MKLHVLRKHMHFLKETLTMKTVCAFLKVAIRRLKASFVGLEPL